MKTSAGRAVCYTLFVAVLSLFFPAACFAVVAPDLNNVIAYPNPFKPSVSAATAVTFDNLTAGSIRLRVFKMTGELIFDDQAESSAGKIQWHVIDDDTNPAASGLYIYVITNGAGQKAKGKIAVIK